MFQELFPANKRNQETFCAYFREKGLGSIADMQTTTLATKAKKEAQKTLSDMISSDSSVTDVNIFTFAFSSQPITNHGMQYAVMH